MKWLLKSLKTGLLLFLIMIVVVLTSNLWVIFTTRSQIYTMEGLVPRKNVALILGTSKWTSKGNSNAYFYERIKSAAALYHAGKVRHIIVSGDNRFEEYNEPRDMYQALLELDVPKGAITLDYAGRRTLDSVIRAKEIFGQSDLIIVTQNFHAYRALFIANEKELDAVAFAASESTVLVTSTSFREFLARFLAVLDVYVFNTQPTILGDREPIRL